MVTDGFPILLVEDNKHDIRFVKRALKINNITNPLHIVSNGQACLDFLRHQDGFEDEIAHPRPGIILMDVRMPIMDGIECLRQIKLDSDLRRIPVIMLTTSKEDEDRIRSYELGANAFIQKPVDFDKFVNAVKVTHLFWTLSELP